MLQLGAVLDLDSSVHVLVSALSAWKSCLTASGLLNTLFCLLLWRRSVLKKPRNGLQTYCQKSWRTRSTATRWSSSLFTSPHHWPSSFCTKIAWHVKCIFLCSCSLLILQNIRLLALFLPCSRKYLKQLLNSQKKVERCIESLTSFWSILAMKAVVFKHFLAHLGSGVLVCNIDRTRLKQQLQTVWS